MTGKDTASERVFFGIIDAIEDTQAVVELDNKEIMHMPLSCLPDESTEGERIKITCERDVKETETRARDAKNLLNDILHSA